MRRHLLFLLSRACSRVFALSIPRTIRFADGKTCIARVLNIGDILAFQRYHGMAAIINSSQKMLA